MTSMLRPLALAALLVLSPAALTLPGCGTSVSGPGTDAGTSTCDAATCGPADAGTLPCGTETCGPDQVCIEPCCGGAPLDCVPVPDVGGCPAGYQVVDYCTSDIYSGPGCEELPCTPDPPRCFDIPTACPSALTCECLPQDSCTTNGCEIDGRNVACLGCE
jgi:hypothetical protein